MTRAFWCGIAFAPLAWLALARDLCAQPGGPVSAAESAWRVVLTPEIAKRWLVGARAIRAALLERERARAERTERLLAELGAPKNQAYLVCRDSLARQPQYRDLTDRLSTATVPTIPKAQGRILALAHSACGAMPDGLFEPDTATGPDPEPDFVLVGMRASGLDRVTFVLFAERIIHWGFLEARK